MPRSVRLLLLGLAAMVVLSPLVRSPQSDTYPLSTYPMFATDRGDEHRIPTVVEVLGDGTTARLSPELIAGTDELVLTAVTVSRAVRDGQVDALCAEVADRLGAGRRARVQTELHDVIDLVADGAPPIAIEVHAECGGA
ncbi:MAG: hypothetical protein R2707_03880 [Acidimicrobiales bacterium]